MSAADRVDRDARARLACAFAVICVLAFCRHFAVLAIGLGLGVGLVFFAGAPLSRLVGRLRAINAFVAFLFLVAPFSGAGNALFRIGPLTYGSDGALFCLRAALKINAIALIAFAALAPFDIAAFVRALAGVGVSPKLAWLFLFTARYVDTLGREYHRCRMAMAARGFRPRSDLRSLRIFASLAGWVLVKALDRSERTLDAMRCRLFSGRYYRTDRFDLARSDLVAVCLTVVLIGLLIWGERAL